MSSSKPSSVTIIPQGALIQYFHVGGQNIVCSLPKPELYRTENKPYFGETIGRTSNRIAGAKIHNLNGRDYDLFANNGPNCLHGGKEGWGKKIWTGPTKETRNGKEAERWTYVSKDGDEGFPGTIEARVWYSVQHEGEKIILESEYEAELVGDEAEETVVAMTNHSYFNISGGPTIEGTVVDLASTLHLPTDKNQIPTGKIEPFPGIPTAGTPFTFGASEPKMDHCLIVDTDPASVPIDTRSRSLHRLITLSHPDTKITLVVESTEPSFQVYTGDGTDIPSFDGQPALGARSGVAIEPSRYVNAVGVPDWRGMVLLRKGQKFGSKSKYTAWKA